MSAIETYQLHDAEIIAVFVDRLSGLARLDFRLTNGSLCTAEMHGLKAFRCEDFTLQNVVSRLFLSDQNEISQDGLDYWLNWSTSLSDAGSWLSNERRREWLDACLSGGLNLLIIEPSAGAQIAAVCEHFMFK